jgi:MFS transporter, ACS family, D-galactonate transporter
MSVHSSTLLPVESQAKFSPELSRVATLLALSIFINYVDRGNLSIAAPLIQNDLALSVNQLGELLAAFFVTYAIFQVVSGWLVDRFSVNSVLALGVLVWSAATFFSGLVHGFALLLAMRLILGAGESVSYPSYSKIIATHFGESQRGRVNALISAGQACGLALGTLLGALLIGRIGWRLFFVVLGLASALWLVPWLKFKPAEEGTRESQAAQAATLWQILQQRSAWGTFGGLLCYNYLSYFLITWLPFYLFRERQFSFTKMSIVSAGAFFAIALSALISGWISDRWIASGASVTRVRKTFTGAGAIIACSIVLVSIAADHLVAVTILVLVCVGMGMCTSNLWAVTQTLAGPNTAGKWTGLQNFIGNLAGWIAPTLTGFLVGRTGRFFWAFAITSMVTLLGSASWIFVVGPVKQVEWAVPQTSPGLESI